MEHSTRDGRNGPEDHNSANPSQPPPRSGHPEPGSMDFLGRLPLGDLRRLGFESPVHDTGAAGTDTYSPHPQSSTARSPFTPAADGRLGPLPQPGNHQPVFNTSDFDPMDSFTVEAYTRNDSLYDYPPPQNGDDSVQAHYGHNSNGPQSPEHPAQTGESTSTGELPHGTVPSRDEAAVSQLTPPPPPPSEDSEPRSNMAPPLDLEKLACSKTLAPTTGK